MKGTGPGWLTGKLSDFAGLYLFPFLLAVLLSPAIRSRRVLRISAMGATALVFASMKVFPEIAQAAGLLASSVTGSPSAIVADPTDLVALAVLVPAHLLWVSIEQRPPDSSRLSTVFIVLIAGVATVATSSIDGPHVDSVWTHQDQLYAIVDPGDAADETETPRLYRRVDEGSWIELIHPAEGTDALLAEPRNPRSFDAGCNPVRTSECEAQHEVGEEVSEDGGITWQPSSLADPPAVYGFPSGGSTLLLVSLVCEGYNPLDPDERVCRRVLSPQHAVYGHTNQTATGSEPEWQTSSIEQGAIDRLDALGRCHGEDTSLCYRERFGSWFYYRSSDGGVTWEQTDGLDGSAAADLDLLQPVHCTAETCYRIVRKAELEGRATLQESSDGGNTWVESQMYAPIGGGNSLAANDKAVVVGVGSRGVVAFDESGDWSYEGIGEITTPEGSVPSVSPETESQRLSALLFAVFYVTFAVAFAASLILVRGMPRKARIGSALYALGGSVYVTSVAWLASRELPLAVVSNDSAMGLAVNGAVFFGIPLTALVGTGLAAKSGNLSTGIVPRVIFSAAIASLGAFAIVFVTNLSEFGSV